MTLTPIARKECITSRLQTAFSPEMLEVIDESHHHIGHEGAKGGGSHFAVVITSKAFEGLSLLQRHQRIYAVLQDLIPHEVHALKIKAHIPLNPSN